MCESENKLEKVSEQLTASKQENNTLKEEVNLVHWSLLVVYTGQCFEDRLKTNWCNAIGYVGRVCRHGCMFVCV